MLSRRTFLEIAAASGLAAHLGCSGKPSAKKRKKLAIIASIWTYLSHAQHFGDRFLVGYPRKGRWHLPEMDVVSLYVDQKPEGDQSQARASEFGFQVYPTVQEALRCGGDKLAVDAVVLIIEHGDYPRNAKGQVLYPRYELFQQVVEVFEQDGRAVPVFNDKHLSWKWEWAKEMVDISRELDFAFMAGSSVPVTPRLPSIDMPLGVEIEEASYDTAKAKKMVADSKRLGFPLLAGSSLPVTWRIPAIEFPLDCVIEEALMVGVGSSDASDYHALEAMQCMVERRRGGESGIKSVQLIQGDAVWKAGEEGRWSKRLLEAALSRSNALLGDTLIDARPQDLANNGQLPKIVKEPAAYFIEHADGLQSTLLMLNGGVGDRTFAARLQGVPEPQSILFQLPPTPNVAYSACLVEKIEEMIETGRAPFPAERTLIVSGILDHCLESKVQGNRKLETPELQIRYRPPEGSHFCRA
jgi:hypothetical protein